MPLTGGYRRLAKYTTKTDAMTAADALSMAMAAIDADFSLSRSKKGKSEHFWRVMAAKSKQKPRDSA